MTAKGKKNLYRKTAITVGALLIVATVASILGSLVILSPILNAPDYLVEVAANENQMSLGILLELTNSIAVVLIAVLLFPIIKKYSGALAIGYVSFRTIESVILIVGSISLLSLLTLSQEYVQAALPDTPYFQALASVLVSVHDWTDLLGAMIVFSLTALILNYFLYQSNLVPRFISVWGLVGAVLMLAAGLFGLFGLGYLSPISILLGLPLALNEMVLAVWLIVKGFNSSAIASESAKPNMDLV
jgi:hypothetical protein